MLCNCNCLMYSLLSVCYFLTTPSMIFIHNFHSVFDAPGTDPEMSPPYLGCHRPKGPSVWATSDSHKASGGCIYNIRPTGFTDIGHHCFLMLLYTIDTIFQGWSVISEQLKKKVLIYWHKAPGGYVSIRGRSKYWTHSRTPSVILLNELRGFCCE